MDAKTFFSIVFAVLALLVLALIKVRKNAQPSKPNALALIRKGKAAQGMAMLRILADKGDAEAEYLHGIVAFKAGDKATFVESIRKAATSGFSPAALVLAQSLMAGDVVTQDLKQAEELLKPLAEAGDKEAVPLLLKVYAMSDNRAAFDKLAAKTNLESLASRKEAAGDIWKNEMQYQIPGHPDPKSEAARKTQKEAVDKAVDTIHAAIIAGCSSGGKVDYRTALNAAGALAGFGCQAGIRDGVVAAGKVTAADAFTAVRTVSGETYYFGDTLNQALFEFPKSVYSLILGGVVAAGGKVLPNIEEMAKRVVASVGSEDFDTLPLPESERPAESPSEALRRFWPLLYPGLRAEYASRDKGGIDPNELGWLFAFAAQRLVREAKGEVPAEVAGAIAMEAAMRTSKLDPETVFSS